MVTLYHHPFSRAATCLWMLEEVGVEHEIKFVDLMAGAHKSEDMLAKNPMGKLPILEDNGVIVTETAAIGLYLADRYASGTLAPPLDDPRRGTYLRWSLFAPSVVEPGATAQMSKWDFTPSRVGWGSYETMLKAMESAVADRDYVLGDMFSMADVIFGSTVRFLLQFEMLEPRPIFTDYVKRLEARPALQRADARNAEIAATHDLKTGA